MAYGREKTIDRIELVNSAMREIQLNYRNASLSKVADAYSVSVAYVSECVKAETGKTYKALLHRRRLDMAAHLLRRSDMKVTQIIRQVGYENSSYFHRLFYARYGQTPLEYRRCHICAAQRSGTSLSA